MRKLELIVTAAMVAVASPAAAQGRGHARGASVPPGQLPPAGMCRVWIDGVPPGRQPRPTDCATAYMMRPWNGRVIYGSGSSAFPGRGQGRWQHVQRRDDERGYQDDRGSQWPSTEQRRMRQRGDDDERGEERGEERDRGDQWRRAEQQRWQHDEQRGGESDRYDRERQHDRHGSRDASRSSRQNGDWHRANP